MNNLVKVRNDLFERMWKAGNESYSSNQNPTCIVHAITQLFDKQCPFYEPTMTKEGMFSEAMTATVFTTSCSAYALLNLLVHHPRVYKRLQKETDIIIGHDRLPNIFDRDSMPYTVATIQELLRIHSLVPALLPHVAMEDSTVSGYKLPAGTVVFPLVCFMHHDEKFWGDPLVFRPERFLDDTGKLLPPEHPNRKHCLQFGAGVRECVGEIFALRRLFIFVTSLAQAFDLEPGDVKVSCNPADYEESLALTQKSFKARLIERNA